MKTKTISAILVTLSLLAFGATAVTAQEGKPAAQATTPDKDKDKVSHDAKMMAQEPHNVLAMAYHESLCAFAKALHGQTVGAGPVNVEFARAAVVEMRRSFDQMKKQNEAYMETISTEVRTTTAPMMQELETHRADLNAQLTALEEEVKLETPDAKKVATLAASVHTRLDSMSKAHQDKMTMKN